ncbi:putative ribonuclease H-like domain-containing protein [Tanacetum coccineum]
MRNGFAPDARIEAKKNNSGLCSFMCFTVYQMLSKWLFFYMVKLKRRCMYVNLQVLKILTILIKFIYKVLKALYWTSSQHKPELDDIIFGSTKKELCDEFEKLMKDKFQMSSMGELTFFLGLQVQQKKKGIFISQDKYVHEILKKFNYTDVNVQDWIPLDVISTSRPNNQVCSFVHVQGFRVRISIGVSAYHTDSDYAGLHLIGSQPTVEVVQFLGNSLISWRMQETNWGLPPQQLNLEYGGCCKLPWTRS